MHSWIAYNYSLTERLKKKVKQTQLKVLKHDFEPVDAYDLDVLQLDPNQNVLHREIIMYGDNTPCWYARTIIPEATYQAEEQTFAELEHKTLGDIIYHHPNITRHIEPVEESFLSGRLSRFIINETDPFYLLEIFLPGLHKYDD